MPVTPAANSKVLHSAATGSHRLISENQCGKSFPWKEGIPDSNRPATESVVIACSKHAAMSSVQQPVCDFRPLKHLCSAIERVALADSVQVELDIRIRELNLAGTAH